jgi:peptide/nickel transport system permease protein
MNWRNLLRRVVMLLAVIVTAASLNFVLPKLAAKNPIETKLLELSEQGGSLTDISGLVRSYQEKFGLDQPVLQQYFNYLAGLATFDLGYSIAFYPMRVADLIRVALPWTIGLLLVSTLLAFAIGTLLGALVAWEGTPRWLTRAAPGVIMLAALPYYLLGLVLVYLFAFVWNLLPLHGGYSLMAMPSWSWSFAGDVLLHALLPAASIVLSSIGAWALASRGLMVMVQGEDFMLYAQANGLSARRRFVSFGLGNVWLPQVTALALHLGHIAAGAVLVERVFAYPGLGMLLFRAIEQSDYFVIYGVVYIMVVMVAVAMLITELLYPLLDPRLRGGAAG